jgi:putative membrane protein
MMMGLGIGSGLLGLVLMELFWGGLIALAIWLVRSWFPGVDKRARGSSFQELSAREILDRRYARGEITREEHSVMKETLFSA